MPCYPYHPLLDVEFKFDGLIPVLKSDDLSSLIPGPWTSLVLANCGRGGLTAYLLSYARGQGESLSQASGPREAVVSLTRPNMPGLIHQTITSSSCVSNLLRFSARWEGRMH